MVSSVSTFLGSAQALGSALAVGLLVGLERGWRDRHLPDGARVAGLRTFGLIGLFGGALGLSSDGAPLAVAIGLTCVAVLFAASYCRASGAAGTLSITTAVAALVTFALGSMAATGQPALAVGAAVVVALLLDLKPVLHRWLRLIEPGELNAVLQLGVLSAVVLPALPDAGYGPYSSINPFRSWLAVIVIASLSLAGHVASRWRGERQGLLWVGLIGGLASSTAATLALARTTRSQPHLAGAAAAAAQAACGVMFVRMAVVVAALRPVLASTLGAVLIVLAACAFVVAAWQWRSTANASSSSAAAPRTRVFDLPSAILFGAVLAVVALIARAAREAFGTAGLYGVAFFSGLADVDAMVIASVQMLAQGELTTAVAATLVVITAAANQAMKTAMAFAIGGRRLGVDLARGYVLVALAGAVLVAAAMLI